MSSLQKKVCLLGEFAVGKTSLVRRFIEGVFEDKYLSTIGTKVSRKKFQFSKGTQNIGLTMLIWDLAGGEKFDRMMRNYYRGSAGAIIVCDLTRPETTQALERYAQDFWSINANAPLVVVGNKADLVDERRVSDEELAVAAKKCQANYFVSSAKTGKDVETLFEALGQKIIA
ncbi:Rab family GTPase [Anaerolineales bacterium HSG24]|nr:Rab family GTPase [Anaerolineales bacterium HSG24]